MVNFQRIVVASLLVFGFSTTHVSASAPIEIKATSGIRWDPKETTVRTGDVIIWKIEGGFHGLKFDDWNTAKNVFEIMSVSGQQPFNANTGRNNAGTGTANKVLLKVKIKQIPDGMTEVPFTCIIHPNMKGTLKLKSEPDPIEIKATISIRWDPKETTVRTGDVIIWKIQGGIHGLKFDDWNTAKDVFEIIPVTDQQPFDADTGRNPNRTDKPNKVLLKVKVKQIPDGMTEVPFSCIVHPNMKGMLKLNSEPDPIEIQATSGIRWAPQETTVRTGDVIIWKIQGGIHGLKFDDWNTAKDIFEIIPVTDQQPFDADTGRNPNRTDKPNKVLLKVKVKQIPDGMTEVPFTCIVHPNMKGTLKLKTEN